MNKPTILPSHKAHTGSADNWLQRLGRRAMLNLIKEIRQGQITVIEGDACHQVGARTSACQLAATIEVLHPQFWADAAFGGTVGAGEAFIRGHWRVDDLTALIRIMVINRATMNEMEGGLAFLTAPLRHILHWLNRNSPEGSRRNIAAHYDLGNDFFALFLDETMAYSCGIFERPDATLYDASVAKFDAACRKLGLQPQDHLLEIGTGWGGLAIRVA